MRGLPPVPPQTGVNVVKLTFASPVRPKDFPQPRPPVVPISPTGPTHLKPISAEFFGYIRKGHKILVKPDQQVMTRWLRTDQRAVWRVRCERAGTYALSMEFSCPERFAGSSFIVTCGRQVLRGTVPASPPERFVTRRVGVLRLPEGTSRIVIRPTRILRMWHFADVGAVMLRPAVREGGRRG